MNKLTRIKRLARATEQCTILLHSFFAKFNCLSIRIIDYYIREGFILPDTEGRN